MLSSLLSPFDHFPPRFHEETIRGFVVGALALCALMVVG